MTTRSSSGLFFAFAAASVLACGGAFAFTACSSSTASDGSDGGTDAATDTRKVVEAGPEVDSGPTLSCVDQCAADHPKSVATSDAIDTCWMTNCADPCGGTDAGFDGEAGTIPDGGSVCGTPITSDTIACDTCTEAFCCAQWKACFNDTDCTAYNECLNKCP